MSAALARRTGRTLPVREMKAIDKKLLPSIQVQETVLSYTPPLLAQALGPNSGIPNAWTAVIWASNAV